MHKTDETARRRNAANMRRLAALAIHARQSKMRLDQILSMLDAQDLGDHLYVEIGDPGMSRSLVLELLELLHGAVQRAIVTRYDGKVWRWDENTPDAEWVEQGLISYEDWLAKIMVAP